jgi:hypothetical protein
MAGDGANDGTPAGDAPADTPPPKRRQHFRAASTVPRLSADETLREGRIVRLAFELLGAAGAQAFLNTFDPAIDGRPLAVATASAGGATTVEDMIRARHGAGSGTTAPMTPPRA